MNFRVIDGNDDWLDLIPQFIELYNNKQIKVWELRNILGIGIKTYNQLYRHCRDEGLIRLRRKPNKPKQTYKTHPKHYSMECKYYGNSFSIRKRNVYYCTCSSVEEAEWIVEKLKECDWDKSQVDRIKSEVKEMVKE